MERTPFSASLIFLKVCSPKNAPHLKAVFEKKKTTLGIYCVLSNQPENLSIKSQTTPNFEFSRIIFSIDRFTKNLMILDFHNEVNHIYLAIFQR